MNESNLVSGLQGSFVGCHSSIYSILEPTHHSTFRQTIKSLSQKLLLYRTREDLLDMTLSLCAFFCFAQRQGV